MATTERATEGWLELRPAEVEVLAEEIPAFARTLKDPDARGRYAQLVRAVQEGAVSPELVPPLEVMLELLLQTQRIRRGHGPEAEAALSELFYRTPRGAGLRQAARDVNRALEAIQGQTVEKITVMAGPGRHTLAIVSDQCRLTLRLDRAGARVEKVEIGG